ncbi:hypothetical protein E2C01_029449 [Portunus trituberculatus]|uniref:Uncharacterized protein n=1 Tax=Portunus trituberculatus TaxID=210409 RepID=A0A5B7ERZ8_PORTR|nr:hypothetical protein [Portunus trituberculatus]
MCPTLRGHLEAPRTERRTPSGTAPPAPTTSDYRI